MTQLSKTPGLSRRQISLSIASQAARSTDYGLLLAGAVIVLLPVLVLFIFLQKYFVRGIAMSGLK